MPTDVASCKPKYTDKLTTTTARFLRPHKGIGNHTWRTTYESYSAYTTDVRTLC